MKYKTSFLIMFCGLSGWIGCPLIALAAPTPEPLKHNYHLVGWTNAFIPGGGQAMMGDYGKAAFQLGVEGTTFGVGYALSSIWPFTLDGVPEDMPYRSNKTVLYTTCARKNNRGVCIQNRSVMQTTPDNDENNFMRPITAMMLQEFAIKYHMVNVFESYREAATVDGKVQDPWIDSRPTKELFLDPFRWDNLKSPWVWAPIGVVAAYTLLDYYTQISQGLFALSRMNWYSNAAFGLNYMVWQPIGSGAPEEMFYRGFLQNEAYHAVPSPFFSVALSTAAFSFSHAPDGRLGAAMSGLYLGTLAQINHGNLAKGIAVHFWSVVLLGIETFLLTYDAQVDGSPLGASIQLHF